MSVLFAVVVWVIFALLLITSYISLLAGLLKQTNPGGGPFDTIMDIAIYVAALCLPLLPFIVPMLGQGISFFRCANHFFLWAYENARTDNQRLVYLASPFLVSISYFAIGIKLMEKHMDNDENIKNGNSFLVQFVIFYIPLLALRWFLSARYHWPGISIFFGNVAAFLVRNAVLIGALAGVVGILTGIAKFADWLRSKKKKDENLDQSKQE